MKLKLIILSLILANLSLYSQEKKFFIGINVGTKLANKNYALRYTGVYQNELPLLFSNQTIHQQIYQVLGNKDFAFYQFNERYKYNPAMNYGLFLGYALSPNLQAGIDVNFSKLKVQTSYNLEVFDPSNQTTQGVYENGNILGEEGRFNGKFNLDYISDGDKAKLIVGVQGLFTSWRMERQLIELKNEQWLYDLYSKHNATNNFIKRVSGSGWGYGVNLGVEFKLNDKYTGQLIYQPYMSRVDYFNTKSDIEAAGNNYIKPKMRVEHDIMLRLLMK